MTMLPPLFEARPSRRRLVLLLFGCIALIAASVFILLYPERITRFRPIAWPAALIGIPFFTLGLVICGRMMMSRSAQVRIDGSGIYWSRWRPEPVPFSAIADAWPLEIANQKMLCLSLKEPESYPVSSRILRATAKANRSMGAGDIAISMTGLDRSSDELFSAYQEWSRVAQGWSRG